MNKLSELKLNVLVNAYVNAALPDYSRGNMAHAITLNMWSYTELLKRFGQDLLENNPSTSDCGTRRNTLSRREKIDNNNS